MTTDKKTTIIANSEDVAALERDIRTHKRRRVGHIALDIANLDKSKQNQLSVEINRGYFACGCAEGTALGFLGLIGMGLYVWSKGMIPADWLTAAGYSLGGFVAGVAIGKFAGKRVATAKLARAVSESVLAPARQSTLELLCSRVVAASAGSKTTEACTPGCRFATMLMPIPLVQQRIPRSCFPSATAQATS